MKKTLTVFLALVVVLGIASGAGASGPQDKIKRLERTVRTLERKVRASRSSYRAERKRAASLGAQVASLTSRNSSLRASLVRRTAERDAAQAETASLQKQLASIPTPLAAAEQYMARVVWAAEATDPARPTGEIVALAALGYVADNHVNLFMRSYLLTHGGLPPLATANATLAAQAGLCGNAAIVFATLVRHLGFTVRSVGFYYDDPPGAPNGHTAAEVYYGGGWHYFDPTFSLYWRDASSGNVLDIHTVRASGGIEHKNNDLLFNVIENPRDRGGGGTGSDTWFETDPATTVLLNAASLNG
jgi:transglutaminase-like putative cysteine protease